MPRCASPMAFVLFCFTIPMIAIGVLGEDIERMYQEAESRPSYTLRRNDVKPIT